MRLDLTLACSTGSLIGAMLLCAMTAHWQITQENRLSTMLLTARLPVVSETRDIHMDVARSVEALADSVLSANPPDVRKARAQERLEYMKGAEKAKQQLLATTTAAALKNETDSAQKIGAQLEAVVGLEDQIEDADDITRPMDGDFTAYHMMREDLSRLTHDLDGTLSDLVLNQTLQMNAGIGRLQQANSRVLRTLWLATLLGALVGGTVSIMLGRRIVTAIQVLARRADAIADGDLTGRALDLGSGDQLGALAAAMNRMQTNLRTIIGTVADTVGTLTGSAASMRSASDQIHQRIDQQSQQTLQAATSMQEMSASIADVSQHTQSAADTAKAAAETAREGGAIVQQMLGAMEKIAMAVSDTSSTVGLLGDDSKRISQIVTVIEEIARKTNLLALNAAIEAARAGDQGRGFAVVAGEVRRLAESTAQATGEIEAMIQEIQDRTRTAVASMESGTGTVRQGVVTTTRAGEALERIIGMAERVDRMITQIAIAASQQATAADQSSESLDSIHKLSNENLREMATTALGIESLRGTAVKLERQVDRFQVTSRKISEERSLGTGEPRDGEIVARAVSTKVAETPV